MTTYTEAELFAAVHAGYHVLDDLPLATRSWLEGYRAGRGAHQPSNTTPIASVKFWFHGECVIQALDPSAALPAGMALYTTPQPVVDVNQQLVEALQKAESHLHAMMAHIDHKPRRFQEHCWQQVLDIRAAIAAAQEQV